MCTADADLLQRGDHAVELRDVGHRSDAHSKHAAARDPIIAHENRAEAAAAQFLREPFGIGGVGKSAGLDE